MTPESARLLAQALTTRNEAEKGLLRLAQTDASSIEVPAPVAALLVTLASTYVHEQRIINRIIHEAVDE